MSRRKVLVPLVLIVLVFQSLFIPILNWLQKSIILSLVSFSCAYEMVWGFLRLLDVLLLLFIVVVLIVRSYQLLHRVCSVGRSYRLCLLVVSVSTVLEGELMPRVRGGSREWRYVCGPVLLPSTEVEERFEVWYRACVVGCVGVRRPAQ